MGDPSLSYGQQDPDWFSIPGNNNRSFLRSSQIGTQFCFNVCYGFNLHKSISSPPIKRSGPFFNTNSQNLYLIMTAWDNTALVLPHPFDALVDFFHDLWEV
jgi:hypothetical protein